MMNIVEILLKVIKQSHRVGPIDAYRIIMLVFLFFGIPKGPKEYHMCMAFELNCNYGF